jgi:hypothetical protein
MSLPEGWEWLDELPDWDPPQELRGPANSVALNLAIKMLSCDILSNDVCALVGEFVTEYSLFNGWFLRDAKGASGDERQLAQVAGIGQEQTRSVYEAWERFNVATTADGPNEEVRQLIQSRRDELAVALNEAVEALSAARSGRV